MSRTDLATLGAALLIGLGAGGRECRAQQGVAEGVGQTLDNAGRGLRRGATEINDVIRKRFDAVQADVDRMGAHHRVYARLHWDKALHGSKIEVHMAKGGGVLLRGVVADAAARQHAVELAGQTEGVTGVVDELTTPVPPPATVPGARPAPVRSRPPR